MLAVAAAVFLLKQADPVEHGTVICTGNELVSRALTGACGWATLYLPAVTPRKSAEPMGRPGHSLTGSKQHRPDL